MTTFPRLSPFTTPRQRRQHSDGHWWAIFAAALIVVAVVLAAAAWGSHSLAEPLRDTAEIVELNHFYDCDGRLVFDQVLFWEWYEDAGEMHVFAWRLHKTPAQFPMPDHRGGYSVTWLDGERFRQVRAISYRETWLQYDPEVEDHRFVPADRRRGLTGEKPLVPPTPHPMNPPPGNHNQTNPRPNNQPQIQER